MRAWTNAPTDQKLKLATPVPYDPGCSFTKLMLGAPSTDIAESDETAVVDATGDQTFTVTKPTDFRTFSISLKYYFTDSSGVVINTIPAAGAAAATIEAKMESTASYQCVSAVAAIGSTSKSFGRAASNTASDRTLVDIWASTVSNPD
jgi:hypothetical protein